MSKPQTVVVLEHLRKRSITQAEAFTKYAIIRLPSVIYDLRKVGHNIDSQIVDVKVGGSEKRMARYTLKREKK